MPSEARTIGSFARAIDELRARPRATWLDLVRCDQSDRWRRGTGVVVEEYLQRLPEIDPRSEEALVLICGEVELRREVGEDPLLDEYQCRFPQVAEELALQFDISHAIDEREKCVADRTIDPREELDLPGYEIIEEIARGASGVVYRARQQSLNRIVAIKVMVDHGTDDRRFARQQQEAEILAHLQHPNVVHIYEVICKGNLFALVMEFIDGPTLGKSLISRALNSRDASRLIRVLSETMHSVHEAGVLHRDLKPSNVLLSTSGQPKITDFGLAKLQSNHNFLTTQDSIIGTPGYMSPEQAIGDLSSVGRESDVYSLGAILYELLTGRPPFLGATVLDTLSLIRDQDPVPPRRLRPKISRNLETICLKCLNKSPRHRYPTALALAEDLQRFEQGLPILARRAGPLERTVRSAQRHPVWSTVVACLLLLMSVAAATTWLTQRKYQQLSDTDLVESITTADSQALPELLGRIRGRPVELLPYIRVQLNSQTVQDAKWLNLKLAEYIADSSADAGSLLEYLKEARTTEILLIVPILASRPDFEQEQMWQRLVDDQATDEARLGFACIAAQVSPDDERWSKIGPEVVQSLVRQHPLDIGALSTLLTPAAQQLIPPLVVLANDQRLETATRKAAVSILTRLAVNQPDTLLALTLNAETDEFRLILPSLEQHAAVVLPQLEKVAREIVSIDDVVIAHNSQSKHEIEWAYDKAQQRRTNALIAIWLLGNSGPALQALRRDGDPALRAWLIELMAPLGVSAKSLWQQARETVDSGVRQAIILSLGQVPPHSMKSADRKALTTDLVTIYRNDPDPGVHSASGWLLRTQLDSAAVIEEIDKAAGMPAADRGWYCGPNGHSFTIIRGPLTFTVGSGTNELAHEADEGLQEEHLDYSFAIATQEVTVAQFHRFRAGKYVNRQYSPTDDCPVNNITWFDAAAYCRWLSEREGLPEEQMCYPPLAEIKPGMQLPSDWLTRKGYRLPTATEWELACRGGVSASRFCGDGGQLLTHYAWYLKNSDDRAWPTGQLKPNELGMFDILGNIRERCQETMRINVRTPATVPPLPQDLSVNADSLKEIRGGGFGDPNQNVRSARRAVNGVLDEWASVGFRVARSW